MLGKFVHDAQAAGAVHLIERLEQDCRSVVSLQILRRVMFLITCICCCFYALFLFDTLGDARGAADSYWIFLVMTMFPVVLYVLGSALRTLDQKPGTDNLFEMATMGAGPAQEGSREVTSTRRQQEVWSQDVGHTETVEIATLSALHSSA
jgi:hypothetical protein